MKKILLIAIAVLPFTSCIVPPCALNHDFTPVDNRISDAPKLRIFSTPKDKTYIITNVDKESQLFIKSPIFDDPEEFDSIVDKNHSGELTKQYTIERKDSKFYKSQLYKTVILKITNRGNEKIIEYTLAKK